MRQECGSLCNWSSDKTGHRIRAEPGNLISTSYQRLSLTRRISVEIDPNCAGKLLQGNLRRGRENAADDVIDYGDIYVLTFDIHRALRPLHGGDERP